MKNKNLIAISGKKGSGKNTVANIIRYLIYKKLVEKGYVKSIHFTLQNFLKLPSLCDYIIELKSFAKPVKDICEIITGEHLKDEDKNRILPKLGITYRNLLTLVGTEFGRNTLYPNVWVDALFRQFDEHSRWIITDLRFQNELEAIKERGGITIRVERDMENTDTHISETELDNYKDWDYVIHNNGTVDDLVQEVDKMLKDIELYEK